MRILFFIIILMFPFLLFAGFQPKQWETWYNQSFTSRNLSTSPLTIGGLQGDLYDYQIITITSPVNALAGIYLRLNGDTGTNYRNYDLYATGTSVYTSYSDVAPTNLSLSVVGANTTYPSISIIEILGKSGSERVMPFKSLTYGTSLYSLTGCWWWKNTADQLSYIELCSAQNVSQTFTIIILRKYKDYSQDAEWELKDKIFLSNTDLSGGIFFRGLNGDSDEEYKIKCHFTVNNASGVTLLLNNDTGTNYYEQYLSNDVGTAGAYTNTNAYAYLGRAGGTSTIPFTAETIIKAKSGMYRSIFTDSGGSTSSYNSNAMITNWWKNSADNIENIKVYAYSASITATGHISLYKKGRKISAIKPAFETLKEMDVDGEFSQGYTFNLAGLGIPDADNESMLILEYHGVSKTASQTNMSIVVILNGDTGSNYLVQGLEAENSTSKAWTSTLSSLSYWLCDSVYPSSNRIYIFPKSGKYRPIIERGITNCNSYAYTFCNAIGWKNSADKLTSIKIYATSANQTSFKGKITLKRLIVNK